MPLSHEIFDKLVDDDEDLEGFIAFGIYKVQEKEWIEKFKKENSGEPSDDELKSFVGAFTNTALNILKNTGKDALAQFAFQSMAQRLDGERELAVNDSILREVKKQNSIWAQAFASALGSVVVTVILIILAVGYFFEISPKQIGERLSNPPVQNQAPQ